MLLLNFYILIFVNDIIIVVNFFKIPYLNKKKRALLSSSKQHDISKNSKFGIPLFFNKPFNYLLTIF